MVKLPSHYNLFLVKLVQTFIQNKTYTKDDIEGMIKEYDNIKMRIKGIKIQGDAANEWWDPGLEQIQVIEGFIFEVLGPYHAKSHLTFYSEEKYGPYRIDHKEYYAYLDTGFPNFILQLKSGKRRKVVIFVLPQHDGI